MLSLNIRVMLCSLLAIIGIQAHAVNNEVESNNALASAMLIAAGQAVKGNISSASDLDIFKLIPTTTGKVRAILRRPPRNYSYNIGMIRALSDSGAEIAKKNIYAPNEYTSLDFNVAAGAIYYIEISGCPSGSDCELHRAKTYELVAINFASPVFESESNDTLQTANFIAANTLVYANHHTKSDLDYFKIFLPGAGDFFVELSRPTDNYAYSLGDMAILDAAGNMLNSGNIYAPEGNSRIVLGTTLPKNIYIRVRSCNSGSRCDIHFGDDYQLLTSFDATAKLSIKNVAVVEGNSGTQAAVFTVKLSEPTTSAVTFRIATSDMTAVSGSDYVALNLSGQSIPAGQISKNFTVLINGDTVKEANESFNINISAAVGATITQGKALGTIINDD